MSGTHLRRCRAVDATKQCAKRLHLQQVLQILAPQSTQKSHVELPEQLHLAGAFRRAVALLLRASAGMLCTAGFAFRTGIDL